MNRIESVIVVYIQAARTKKSMTILSDHDSHKTRIRNRKLRFESIRIINNNE